MTFATTVWPCMSMPGAPPRIRSMRSTLPAGMRVRTDCRESVFEVGRSPLIRTLPAVPAKPRAEPDIGEGKARQPADHVIGGIRPGFGEERGVVAQNAGCGGIRESGGRKSICRKHHCENPACVHACPPRYCSLQRWGSSH